MPQLDDSLIVLTPRETAEIIGIRPETLSRWRSEGRGPACRVDKRTIRYTKEAVAEWLKGQDGEGR